MVTGPGDPELEELLDDELLDDELLDDELLDDELLLELLEEPVPSPALPPQALSKLRHSATESAVVVPERFIYGPQ